VVGRIGRIRWGTSSWSEKAWAGVFYPPGLPAGEQLAHYALRYDTVEADVTYYRVPDERLVRGWDRKTPAGFTLSAKFPRSVVHAGEGAEPDATRLLQPEHCARDVERFLSAMSLLGPKCGPLVLQFPYFNRRAFARPEDFLERLERFLRGLPGDFRYGVELRNKTWVDAPLFALLRAQRAALVLVDHAYLPHPDELFARGDPFTADFAYARLIGDRKRIDAVTDTHDRVVIDQGARLERWARLLVQARERVPETYVYANNHYAGYAPATIDDLAARLARATA
jgi:uncharacterized protein YecE (DUF72 family)